MSDLNCKHLWTLPGSITEATDDEQIEGWCNLCGLREKRPTVVWLNILDQMIQRLYDEDLHGKPSVQ